MDSPTFVLDSEPQAQRLLESIQTSSPLTPLHSSTTAAHTAESTTSDASTSRTLPLLVRPRPVTKTYGRAPQIAIAQSSSSSASGQATASEPDATSSSQLSSIARPSLVSAAPPPTLAQSTSPIVIPETDFSPLPPTIATSSPTTADRVPAGDAETSTSSSSSPTRGRWGKQYDSDQVGVGRDQHSTDPTEVDEEEVRHASNKSNSAALKEMGQGKGNSLMEEESDSDSDSDEEGDETIGKAGPWDWKAQLAKMDEDDDDDDPSTIVTKPVEASLQVPSGTTIPAAPATSISPFTSLIASSSSLLVESNKISSPKPFKTKPRKSVRAIESDDSDSDEVVQSRLFHEEKEQEQVFGLPRPHASLSDDGIEEAFSSDRESSSAHNNVESVKELSKKEKLEALVAKRRAVEGAKEDKKKGKERRESVQPEEQGSEVDEMEVAPKVAKIQKKKGALSRKGEEELNRESAALLRAQHVRIEAKVRPFFNPAEVVKNALSRPSAGSRMASLKPVMKPVSHFQPQTATPDPTQHVKRAKYLPSSASSVINDRSPYPATAPNLPTGIPPSSPIDTPSVAVAPVFVRKPIDFALDDDDEDLPDLDMNQIIARSRKQKEVEKLAALKAAATAAAASKRAQQNDDEDDDDDDDLEIQGAPVRTTVKRSTSAFDSTPKSHSRHRSTSTKLAQQPTLENALTAPRATPHERLLKEIDPKFGVVQEDLSESQTIAAAHTFGKRLGSPKLMKSTKSGLVKTVPVVTKEQTDKDLRAKIAKQNLAERVKKAAKYRKEQNLKAEEEASKVGDKVDVKNLLKIKAEKSKLDKEKMVDDEDEDADDGDYADEDDEEMGDGSGSEKLGIDDEAEENSGEDGENDDDEEESSEKENALPHQRLDDARAGLGSDAMVMSEGIEDDKENQGQDDEEEDSLITVPRSRARFVITGDEDDDEQDTQIEVGVSGMATPAAAPRRVNLPSFLDAGGDGGFSQFFGTAFSQAVGGNNESEGFQRPAAPSDLDSEPNFVGRALIDSAERAKDIELLEARNAFLAEPATPAANLEPAGRQYINKLGFLTQRRPDDLFANSPSDSPLDSSRSTRHLSSIGGSVTQQMTQTQIEATQTPTQASRQGGGLRLSRTTAFSFGIAAAGDTPLGRSMTNETQEEETQEEAETQDTQMLDFPSAAQPPPPATQRNAFDIMLESAKAPPPPPVIAKTKSRGKNDFIQEEAEMSDEEDMMGGASGDENEEGLDQELTEIIDNEEVAGELRAEQDQLALQRYAEDEAKADAEAEARMKRVAEGKERLKRKNGFGELDDEDFDDDDYGQSKNRANKKAKIQNASIEQLGQDEETQSFVGSYREGLIVDVKAGEHDFLNIPSGSDVEAEDSDEDEEERDTFEAQMEEGPRLSRREAERIAIERTRQNRIIEAKRMPSPDIYLDNSSSPAPQIQIKKRSTTVVSVQTTTRTESYEDIDNFSLIKSVQTRQWQADSKEESQGSASNSSKGGAGSSVTGFTAARNGAKATYGGTLEAGSNGKTKILAKATSFGYRKKNNFTS